MNNWKTETKKNIRFYTINLSTLGLFDAVTRLARFSENNFSDSEWYEYTMCKFLLRRRIKKLEEGAERLEQLSDRYADM